MSSSLSLHRIGTVRNGLVLPLALIVLFSLSPAAISAQPLDSIRRIRAIETAEAGVGNPVGLAFSRRADSFLVLPHAEQVQVDLVLLGSRARSVGALKLAVTVADPINMAVDNKNHRLLLYDAGARQLIELDLGRDGIPDPGALTRIPAQGYGIEDARGMAADPVTGRLFLLDGASPRIVVVEPDEQGGLESATISSMDLTQVGSGEFRGLAFDPTSGHLHVLSPTEQRLYEITDTGLVVANRNLSAFGLQNPQGVVFARSSDGTDPPAQQSLYVAEGARTAVARRARSASSRW
jgi:hypothetical protein